MGWIIGEAIVWLWDEFAERRSKGRPWWVWALWALSPLLVAGALIGLLWLLLR